MGSGESSNSGDSQVWQLSLASVMRPKESYYMDVLEMDKGLR